MGDQEVVDKMETVWKSIAELGATFTEAEWKTPTDCPGWSVQDQVAHLVGAEQYYLGRSTPEHTAADTSHVKNEVGERNEHLVDYRRSWTGAQVLEEFQHVTAERVKMLRSLSASDFEAEMQTPLGLGTLRSLLDIRIFDAWTHEQDMRGALNRPGHLEGPVAEHSIGRCCGAMPFVIGRKVRASDNTTVVFELTGPSRGTLAVKVDGKRANILETPPDSPTVKLTMDVETFTRLGCGRWDPIETLQAEKIEIAGDHALGEAIIREMNFMV